ncbi:phosphatase PAP2 family protein [Chitinispirillales bacterium ANBcel5]|uniref:phosphatase PAP2 family protein n=1 Tax=Cellulosispirillum alkaliphilum TaxID=3039283 RepID=UPI002A50D1D4|nr:phosphatase PAP2 family protein [Chitinispirillales bacterium ANBcel5]
MLEFLKQIDQELFLFFNSVLIHPFLDFLLPRATHPNFWIIPAFIAVIFFVRKEKKKALIVVGLSLVTVAISDPVSARILKPLFGRLRPSHPEFFIEGGRFLTSMRSSFSFPSSHSMNVFAQAALFSSFYPSKKIWFILFAVFIAYTRVYVGVHYPADVFSGAIFGTAVGLFVYYAYQTITLKFKVNKEVKGELRK